GIKTSGRHGGRGRRGVRRYVVHTGQGFVAVDYTGRGIPAEPLALSAADGMNACIFAYGQTGSGKAHTMIGDAKGGEMAGISCRTMDKLLQVLELRCRQQAEYVFTVKVAMLEIYNEDVRELLSDPSSLPTSGGGGGGEGDGRIGTDGNAGKLEIFRYQDGMVQ
ncbi:unnamed protein product, partial [Pylaiella littoralis]